MSENRKHRLHRQDPIEPLAPKPKPLAPPSSKVPMYDPISAAAQADRPSGYERYGFFTEDPSA